MELISRMQFNESEERLALSTVTASRRLQFCAGHRVYGHESKCANLHGHNYVVFLYARSENELNGDGLDSLGRVVDFGQLKSLFAPWIEDNWDHGFIVSRNDLEAQQALNMIPGQKLFVMDSNPTAENMAMQIGKYIHFFKNYISLLRRHDYRLG